MLFIAGISISVFLVALLLFKKDKAKADWVLILWFLFIAAHLLLYYFDISGFIAKHPFLAGLIIPFPLVHGPFLFLYVSALTNRLPRNSFFNALHFLPFVLTYIYLARFFILPGEQKLYILQHQGVGFEGFVKLNLLMIILSGVGYIVTSLLFISKHQKLIRDEYSNIEKVNLRWLQYLTYGLGIIWIIVIVGNETHIFSAVVTYMVVIGILGIKQVDIFTNDTPQKKNQPILFQPSETEIPNGEKREKDSSKYEKSGLTDETKAELQQQLDSLINHEKVYCISNLSLNELAAKLDVHPNYLSQYINEELDSTFYDYINKLRVDEFKRIAILPENKSYSMLSLAFDCGFSSKSSFNRNFKKFTGQTPSQYLKSVKNKASN